jgi:lysozyme
MTLTARAQLRQDVMAAEGCRLKPYKDTVGKWTVGYGRNLSDVGITKLEAEVLLDHDLADAELQCRKTFEWFEALSDARQRAVTELVFNLGLKGFSGFTKTIAAIRAKDFQMAAANLLKSKWKTDVGPTRSNRIAELLRRG